MEFAIGIDVALIIQLLISTILPILVGLVTKRTTPGGFQALLLAGLAIVTSFLTEFLSALSRAGTFDFGVWLVGAITSFVVAVATHYGLWKPTGATAKALAVGDHDDYRRAA